MVYVSSWGLAGAELSKLNHTFKMRILKFLSPSLLIARAALVNAASSSWGFSEAIVSIQGKGPSGGLKDK
jgi:hypothetical protein